MRIGRRPERDPDLERLLEMIDRGGSGIDLGKLTDQEIMARLFKR